jgi:uncharacterized protein (DUF305 family)
MSMHHVEAFYRKHLEAKVDAQAAEVARLTAALTQVTRERDEAKGWVDAWTNAAKSHGEAAAIAEARVAKLREALAEIADLPSHRHDECGALALAALLGDGE